MQNEFYYKSKIENALEKVINEITKDDNELGWISDNLVRNMTEAAWLVIKQNKDTNQYFEDNNMIKS